MNMLNIIVYRIDTIISITYDIDIQINITELYLIFIFEY